MNTHTPNGYTLKIRWEEKLGREMGGSIDRLQSKEGLQEDGNVPLRGVTFPLRGVLKVAQKKQIHL